MSVGVLVAVPKESAEESERRETGGGAYGAGIAAVRSGCRGNEARVDVEQGIGVKWE